MNDTHKTGAQIFISYSHADKKAKDELMPHLKTLKKIYSVNIWHDGMIFAGGEIKNSILEALENSQIILLLISANYISSEFCYSIELKRALERHEKGECLIVPIMIKPIPTLEGLPFAKLKCIPFDARPISSTRPKDKGYAAAVSDLEKLLQLYDPDPTPPFDSDAADMKSNHDDSIPEVYPYIHLYKDGELSNIKLPQEIVESLPSYVQHLITFYDMALILTTTHVDQYHKTVNNTTKKNRSLTNQTRLRLFREYLFELCAYLTRYLLGNTGVRVHFRGLLGNQYIGLVVNNGATKVTPPEKWAKYLTPMPADRGMIYQSNLLNAPLIKSLNPNFHEKGTHDEIWIEYLTCALKSIDPSIYSLLSMGVSVNKDANAKIFPLLQFLAYTRIDIIICQILKKYCQACQRIDNKFNIKSIIEAYN